MQKIHESPFTHALPAHTKHQPSPLSSHHPLDYRGFHNLILLLLFVNNFRLALENYLKYGFFFYNQQQQQQEDILFWERNFKDILALGKCLLGVPVWILGIWIFERFGFYNHFQKHLLTGLWLTWLFGGVYLLNYYAYYEIRHPMLASPPTVVSIVLLLKFVSYRLVYSELHQSQLLTPAKKPTAVEKSKNMKQEKSADDSKSDVFHYDLQSVYPACLSLFNLIYFLLAPTLCYQPIYPRMKRFRKFFFFKRLIELITIGSMMYFITEQYSRPLLKNSLKPFRELDFFALFERILKLSIPSIYVWLLMFYLIFHSYLNLVAEILLFADRSFYLAWWNATTIAEYWRLWNLPVYHWFKRHIYVPVLRRGYPKILAGVLAFFISAIGHEMIVGIPLKVVKGWAFWGMMSQIPLIWLTQMVKQWENRPVANTNIDDNQRETEGKSKKGMFGNYLFWISFCVLGQPLMILLYYRQWYLQQQSE